MIVYAEIKVQLTSSDVLNSVRSDFHDFISTIHYEDHNCIEHNISIAKLKLFSIIRLDWFKIWNPPSLRQWALSDIKWIVSLIFPLDIWSQYGKYVSQNSDTLWQHFSCSKQNLRWLHKALCRNNWHSCMVSCIRGDAPDCQFSGTRYLQLFSPLYPPFCLISPYFLHFFHVSPPFLLISPLFPTCYDAMLRHSCAVSCLRGDAPHVQFCKSWSWLPAPR